MQQELFHHHCVTFYALKSTQTADDVTLIDISIRVSYYYRQ